MQSTRFAIVPLLIALSTSACIGPATIDKMGDEEAARVEQEMGLVTDPVLAAYVRRVGERMVPLSERPDGPWTFQIVDAPEPNAFALPGGHVWVSRGLLALVNSEDELAGVIGHEMGHVTAGHARKRIGMGVLTAPITIATGLAGLAAGIVSPKVGGLLAGSGQLVTEGLVIAPRSREQENEADALGQKLAAAAGYDPGALAEFLHSLDREVELVSGEHQKASFLDTHPLSADRVAKTRARAGTLTRGTPAPVAADRAAMLAKLDGLLVGGDPAQGVMDGHRFLHPDLDLTITLPDGWAVRNLPDAVAAISPEKNALITLQIAGTGTSVDALLEEVAQEGGKLEFERFEIGDRPAARTRAEGRGRLAELVIVEHRGDVYALVGQAAKDAEAGMSDALGATVASFRGLQPAERESIREARLRIRPARKGESLESLAKRTGSAFSAEALAIANGVELGHVFQAGQPVKLAMPEPYRPR